MRFMIIIIFIFHRKFVKFSPVQVWNKPFKPAILVETKFSLSRDRSTHSTITISMVSYKPTHYDLSWLLETVYFTHGRLKRRPQNNPVAETGRKIKVIAYT